ncbi:hypothetical protein QMU85_002184 [Photobacterium damselae]|nr:hypothetical protein [Photobacterium damselae]
MCKNRLAGAWGLGLAIIVGFTFPCQAKVTLDNLKTEPLDNYGASLAPSSQWATNNPIPNSSLIPPSSAKKNYWRTTLSYGNYEQLKNSTDWICALAGFSSDTSGGGSNDELQVSVYVAGNSWFARANQGRGRVSASVVCWER